MRFERGEVQPDSTVRDVLYLPDGGRYVFPTNPNATGWVREAEKYIDVNGNQMLYDALQRRWTDTMGRHLVNPLVTQHHLTTLTEGTQQFEVAGIGTGVNRQYQLVWKKLKRPECVSDTNPTCGETVLENPSDALYYAGSSTCPQDWAAGLPVAPALFQGNEGTSTSGSVVTNIKRRMCDTQFGEPSLHFNPVVLSKVILPDQRAYEFKYNRYGEITKIIYPTGAVERFLYGEVQPIGYAMEPVYDQTNRGVLEHWVTDGDISRHWVYGYENIQVGSTTHQGIRATAPDGSKTIRAVHRSLSDGYGFEDSEAGFPFEERSYDSNGSLRQRKLTKWGRSGPQGPDGWFAANRDPKPLGEFSVSIEGQKALATYTSTEYDSHTDLGYFAHLNPKRVKSYHFLEIPLADALYRDFAWFEGQFASNGQLSSLFETDYSYDPNYKARGISSRPVETRVLNPANPTGPPLAKTQILYDESLYLQADSGVLSGQAAATWVNPNTNLRGLVTTQRVWNSDTSSGIETHTQYDQYGNVRKAFDPIGNIAETVYSTDYACAYPTRLTTPAPDPNNTGHGTTETSTVSTTYDFNTGLPLTVTDDFGQTVATEYIDPLLRPTRTFGVNFTAPESQTIYGDTPGNLFVKVRKQIDETNWDEATTFIDGLGRSFKTQAKDSQGDVFVETKYDNLGRVAATSNPYRTGDTVYWSKPRYDELNRVVETYAPEAGNPLDPNIHGASLGVTSFGISTVPNYVGTVVTTTDASLRKGRSITNALGQLVRVDEPTGISASADTDLGTLATPNQPTFYTYSPQGKMVKVQQGVQNRYFLYDSLGRLIRVRQPEQEINASLNLSDPVTGNSQWTAGFAYDVLGNVVRATDANGVNIVNEYDRANRVKIRCYTKPNISATATTCASIPANDQSTDTPSVSFYYDGKGLAAPQSPNYAKGKLTKVDNGISATEYMTFDNLGRLTRSRQVTDGVVYGDDEHPITYSYNLSGGLVQETYPSGRVVKNEFEPDGDLARIFGKANATATERTYANAFAYTPDGKIESLRLGNLLWEKAKFNTRLQTTEIALGHGVSSGDLWKLNYEFGELNTDGSVDTTKNTGNIARQTVSFNGLPQPFVQSYKYDSLYRLTEARETSGTAANASQTWRETFGYDRFGNRTGHTKFYGTTQAAQNNVTDPIIDPNTNRFQSGQGYLFDKNGNLTTDAENRTTTFNGDNKQTKVIQNGQLVGEYFYDGEGKRVKKKVYDPNNPNVVTEETIFVYSSGKLVAEYSTKPPPPNPTTSYTATDMLGSPRVITNALGEVTSRRDFMPFGEQVYSEPSFRPTSLKYNTGDDVRQKFTGYQKDEETQLDFAEARMYQNKHGRFTAIDPLLASGKSPSPQTFNRYVYVMNNPLAFTDPSGLQAATTPLQNVYPCERNDCAYTINGTGRNPILTVNTRPLDTTTITAEPDLIAMSAPVTLGTVITTRLPLLAGGASTATTAGAASVAAPAAAAGCAALLCALLASRIGDYTPGGIYDATVNRPTWRDGYPVISTIGGSNTQIGNPALAIPIPTTTTDRIPAPPPPDTFPGLFRGGPSLAPRPGEFRVRNGLVQSTHGPSTNIDPFKVMRFGGAYRVGPLPLGLTAVQRGVDQGHYEIVPSSPIAVEEYIRLLSMVPLTPYRP